MLNSSGLLHLIRFKLFNLLNDTLKNLMCLINVCIKMENTGSFTFNFVAAFLVERRSTFSVYVGLSGFLYD